MTRRLVILAQFDPDGGLPPHVRIHLEQLRPLATRLVLVSNSPLSPDTRASSEALCDSVIERDNIGWDFAAWRDALGQEDMHAWDAVLLTNSSVVGPLYPLAPIIEDMSGRGHDFWGMVHSRSYAPHLQSYFLYFHESVIRSDAWQRFWENVFDLYDKNQVIQRYEVGLTGQLVAAGFTYGHLIPDPKFPRSLRFVHIDRLKNYMKVPLSVNYINKTVELHDEIIRAGMPYLKASLLWGKDAYRFKSIDFIEDIEGMCPQIKALLQAYKY